MKVAQKVVPGRAIASQKFPGYILALTGPSGVGKSTIRRILTEVCSEYTASVPMLTTRKPKQGDDGEYIYTTQTEFDRMVRAGSIIASTQIPSASEHRQYGYRSREIEDIWKQGKIPVVITEMHLLKGLADFYGRRSVLSFGLLPPGRSKRAKLSELLHRLRKRGRESEQHIHDRLKNAEQDLALFVRRKELFDHIVVNDDLPSLIASMRKKVPALSGV